MRGFRTFFGFPFTIRISGSRSSFSAMKRNRENRGIRGAQELPPAERPGVGFGGSRESGSQAQLRNELTVQPLNLGAGPSSKGEDRRRRERKEKQVARK